MYLFLYACDKIFKVFKKHRLYAFKTCMYYIYRIKYRDKKRKIYYINQGDRYV